MGIHSLYMVKLWNIPIQQEKGGKKYWAVSYCLSDPVYEVFLIYFKDLIYFKVDRCILILVMLSYTLSGHSFLQ